MKRFIFLLFAMHLAVAAMADGGLKQYSKVVLALVDGRVFDIDVDADSYIYSYTKGEGAEAVQYVEVNGTREMYLFGRDELMSIKFVESATTAIDEVVITDEQNPMRYINGELVFHYTLNGENFYVYDAAGKLVFEGVALSDVKISLDKLVQGVYLVEVKNYKTKVMVR